MPANPKIIQLRQLLATRGFSHAARPVERLLVGWPALDIAAGDGLPKGDIAELHCAATGGALTMATILNAAMAQRQCVVLLDGPDGFDPESVEPAALKRLLWLRCHSAVEAMKAADLVLRDGNLPLVLLNVRGCADTAHVPSQAWYRLQRIVEVTGVALLVLTPRPMIPSARVRIALHCTFTLDDLERDRAALVAALRFQTGRVQGARTDADETLMAEVG